MAAIAAAPLRGGMLWPGRCNRADRCARREQDVKAAGRSLDPTLGQRLPLGDGERHAFAGRTADERAGQIVVGEQLGLLVDDGRLSSPLRENGVYGAAIRRTGERFIKSFRSGRVVCFCQM